MQKTSNPQELAEIAKQIRRDIIEMLCAAKSGHPGGSLSAVELLVSLYWDVMRHDPSDPKKADRDRFILSKGHAAPVLYSVMARCGYCPVDQLNTLRKMGSIYQGHPDVRFLPVLEASTGSLGQGLSLALGMGSGLKLDGLDARVYVMLGDGESQEGQIWEAAMYGAQHKLDNVCCIVDFNKIQLDGFVADIMGVAALAEKWRSFGWHVVEIDGHNLEQVKAAYVEAAATKGKPTCIVANTIKGKGVSFMENNPKWHGVAPSPEEAAIALKELA